MTFKAYLGSEMGSESSSSGSISPFEGSFYPSFSPPSYDSTVASSFAQGFSSVNSSFPDYSGPTYFPSTIDEASACMQQQQQMMDNSYLSYSHPTYEMDKPVQQKVGPVTIHYYPQDQNQWKSGESQQVPHTQAKSNEQWSAVVKQEQYTGYQQQVQNVTQQRGVVRKREESEDEEPIVKKVCLDKPIASFGIVLATGGKRKRKRTAFTSNQLVQMEREFENSQYLDRCRRAVMAQELGLEERQIKIWFQNRRMKHKKELLPKETKQQVTKSANLRHDQQTPAAVDNLNYQIKRDDQNNFITMHQQSEPAKNFIESTPLTNENFNLYLQETQNTFKQQQNTLQYSAQDPNSNMYVNNFDLGAPFPQETNYDFSFLLQ